MEYNFERKSPFMDYRNSVPFMNLSGFIFNQPIVSDEIPAMSLKQTLFKKRFSSMINIRRLQYKALCEAYRNGQQ